MTAGEKKTMEDFLNIQNLTKRFGGVAAVKDVHLNIPRGIRMGIIGPNGAGKTTLFNMITGELKPSTGSIHFEGHPIHGMKPHRISKQGIGRTFQIVRVFDELSVYENVLIGAVAHEMHLQPKAEQHQKVNQVISLMRLDSERDKMAKNLTVSRKKHVGLAIALAGDPKVLLLDECMAGLTYVEIDEMLEILRVINDEMGITLVVVEHVMKVVMELCQRIAVLASGEKIAEGTPAEITQNQRVIDVYLGEDGQ
jgi:branched-chain amino acid transport system ATP-binding protein